VDCALVQKAKARFSAQFLAQSLRLSPSFVKNSTHRTTLRRYGIMLGPSWGLVAAFYPQVLNCHAHEKNSGRTKYATSLLGLMPNQLK